jgi:hypothetical protein
MGIKIEDLPLRLQAQVRAQLANDARPAGCRTRGSEAAPTPTPAPVADRGMRGKREPNKTESDYRATQLRGMDARYEALTFRMANGHRYTPDWVVFLNGRPVACHECKGGHALGSQQRARLAFDQVKVEFPWIRWVWAVKVGGQWTVSSWQ